MPRCLLSLVLSALMLAPSGVCTCGHDSAAPDCDGPDAECFADADHGDHHAPDRGESPTHGRHAPDCPALGKTVGPHVVRPSGLTNLARFASCPSPAADPSRAGLARWALGRKQRT